MGRSNQYSGYGQCSSEASGVSSSAGSTSSGNWRPPTGQPVQTGPDFVYQAYPVNDSSSRVSSGNSRSKSKSSNARPYSSGMSEEEFAKLCESISETVSNIAQTVGKSLGAAGNAMGDALGNAFSQTKDAHTSSRASKRSNTRSNQEARNAYLNQMSRYKSQSVKLKQRFKSSAAMTASGAVMTFIGAGGVISFGSALLVALFDPGFVALGYYSVQGPISAFSAVGCGLFGWLTVSGIRRLKLSQRLKSFRRIFANREVCSITEISAQLQQKPTKTLSQSRKLIKRGLLPQGHIDDEQSNLMVTDDAYHHYRRLKQQEQQRLIEEQEKTKAQQRAAKEAKAAQKGLPANVKKFLNDGNRFMRRMHELDVAIADKGVSAKIAGIERVLGQIIKRVKDNPAVIDRLPKLMDYYLPTTVKLLEAYDNLEEQPVQGENIAKSRREIENTLDVLHGAYQKLLDDTFQDMSLDVSSDITVLHAVLAQEGLTENPFDKKPDSQN